MTWKLVWYPFPAVRIWFVRSKIVYWQTSTDERRYGDGMATTEWFTKQHPRIERPL